MLRSLADNRWLPRFKLASSTGWRRTAVRRGEIIRMWAESWAAGRENGFLDAAAAVQRLEDSGDAPGFADGAARPARPGPSWLSAVRCDRAQFLIG